ncbi:MAG: tyrosine recombinase [Phycisphaeraceae bacterium]|nr:tyrosine recombinase [Phycisphaeraceae bacterium]
MMWKGPAVAGGPGQGAAARIGTSPTLAMPALVRDFLSYCRIECGFSAATIEAYTADLRDLWQWMQQTSRMDWNRLDLTGITEHLRYLSQSRSLSPRSIARHVATIRVFFRYAHSQDLLENNPAELLNQPSQWSNLPDYLNGTQMQRLLESPQSGDVMYQRDRALLELLYAGGLRASELANLRCQDVHFHVGIVRVIGKGDKERITPVGTPALDATRCYLDELRPQLLRPDRPTDRLLLSRTGNPITRVVVWQVVTRMASRAGLADVHPHTLRHTFATHLLAGGADLRVVQELLGHANIRTTQVYTHVDAGRLRTVISKFHPRP